MIRDGVLKLKTQSRGTGDKGLGYTGLGNYDERGPTQPEELLDRKVAAPV
jgi:hypothetical protein